MALVPSLSALKMRCCDCVLSMFNSCTWKVGMEQGRETPGGVRGSGSIGGMAAAAWLGMPI
jgi:hypothetical protein